MIRFLEWLFCINLREVYMTEIPKQSNNEDINKFSENSDSFTEFINDFNLELCDKCK